MMTLSVLESAHNVTAMQIHCNGHVTANFTRWRWHTLITRCYVHWTHFVLVLFLLIFFCFVLSLSVWVPHAAFVDLVDRLLWTVQFHLCTNCNFASSFSVIEWNSFSVAWIEWPEIWFCSFLVVAIQFNCNFPKIKMRKLHLFFCVHVELWFAIRIAHWNLKREQLK